MRRFFLIFFLSILVLSGCGVDSVVDIVSRSLAEVRVSMSKGTKNGVTATLMCGYREEEYVSNGVCTTPIEFGVLTFSIDGFENYDYKEATYVLNVGMERFSGGLELNPFDSTLVADVGKVMNITENVVAYIDINGTKYEVYLNPVSDSWEIDYRQAIYTFVKTYEKYLKKYISHGSIDGETYVKIVYDEDIDEYYWYINFITPSGDSISMVIDKDTGNILVDKANIL